MKMYWEIYVKKYILLLVTYTFMSKQGFLMSETQNVQSTCSLRKEYYLIPWMAQEAYLFLLIHISPLPAVNILSNNLSWELCYNLTPLPKITMVGVTRVSYLQVPECTLHFLSRAFVPAFPQRRIFFKFPFFLTFLSGLYKCFSLFKI